MRTRFATLLSVMLLSLTLNAQKTRIGQWWNDLSVYQFNKMPPRTNVIPYSDENGVENLEYMNSSYYMNLNGYWKFFFIESPEKEIGQFYSKDFNTNDWDSIAVPGNWELNGFGTPVYVNARNEFTSNPPYAPMDYNPVGRYRHDFNVPKDWDGRKIYLNFGAVKSAFYLWINGKFVGYSEDSKTPAEFDVTPYVKAGSENFLAVEAYRFSDGSYLEAQDFWRMSGITRDVVLYSKPKLNISDFFVKAGLDENYENGTLDVSVDINFDKMPSKCTVEIILTGLDKSGERINKVISREVSKKDLKKFKKSKIYTLNLKQQVIKDVLPWSAETPNLYTLKIRIKEKDKVLETVGAKIGFRTVEIRDGLLKVNGQVVMIKGVNRHEHHGETGQCIDRKIMMEDIKIMLSNNINAVRTSHYPDDIFWYELCDKYGIYVIDEANNESHPQGYGENSLAKKDEWKDVFLYRCKNMVERDKNHPSIIVWSVGNECGNGVCTKACYDWMKQRDTRPVICERAIYDYNTDYIGLMYASVDYLTRFAEEHLDSLNRPFILVEYCHAMGNSCGGLQDYMEVFEKYPQLQGGCIWDFVDQTILRYDPNTSTQWYAAGGDLGNIPNCGNDDSFCVNGLITSDRQEHHHMAEVKKAYQNIKVLPIDLVNGVFNVENHFQFRNLSDFECIYKVLSNEKILQRGRITLDCKPGETQKVFVMMPESLLFTDKPNQEFFINFSFRLKKDDGLLKSGHEVAYEQFQFETPVVKAKPLEKVAKLNLTQNENTIVLGNDNFSFTIDKNEGIPTSFIYREEELLAGAIRPNFWRAPTLNDEVDGNGKCKWEAAGLNNLTVGPNKMIDVKRIDAGHVAVSVTLDMMNRNELVLKVSQIYEVDGEGNVVVTMNVQPTDRVATFPKIGTQMLLPLQYNKVMYFGKDTENYPDRALAGRVGVYENNASNFFEMHEEPQESGNRTDVRWVAISNRLGKGLFISGKQNLNFSIYRYSDADLTMAKRINQIKPAEYWTVNVDYKQAPLGTATCGPDALDKYLIKNDVYEYSFRMRPYEAEEVSPQELYKQGVFDVVKTLPMPEITASSEVFNHKMKVTVKAKGNAKVYYTLDGTEPTQNSKLYTQPFEINSNVTVKAKAYDGKAVPSFTAVKTFERIYIKNTTFEKEPAENYSANKAIALMDKKIGTPGNWRENWLGFNGDNLDAIIELSDPMEIQVLFITYGIAFDQWVLAPKRITVSTSTDGVRYTEPVEAEFAMYDGKKGEFRREARALLGEQNVRFIKLHVENLGVLPEKHPYAGEKSWIMVDELRINNEKKIK